MKTRKLIILGMAIVACMMASCKKDEVKPTNSIVFKASIESHREAGDDKTAIDTSDNEHPGRVVWSEGDKIRIHNGITSGIFTLISGAGQYQGNFGFFDGVYELTEEGGHYLAAYPLTGNINYSENKVVFNMPATQNLGRADSTFANGANPMVAWATSVNEQNFITGLNFKNVCGGIGIRLKGAVEGITVSNIRITSKPINNNNTIDCLWGNLTVNMNNDGTINTISISNEAENKNVIDLSCDFALSTTETKRVFIVLPVGTLSGGFTLDVTYKVGDGEYQNFSRTTIYGNSGAAEVELNKLKSLPVLNIGSNILPIVTTSDISDITSISATCGGTVTSSGGAGATVTERGICWSTSHNPTISGSHANNGSGTGGYTVSMTGLTPNTTYYVRAYAINSEGFIGYGNEVVFKACTISVSANPNNGGTVTGDGTYNQGESCTVTATANTGYTFTNWTEDGSEVSTEANYTFTVTSNRTLEANFTQQSLAPQGAINGLFSVSATQQVYFSQGNLQYQASTNTWQFAEHQWNYIGSDNSNISSTYSGWIDLFGWGTSGYHDSTDPYNVNYYPWSTSLLTVNTEYNDFGYGPSINMTDPNLTGTSANYDWGVYNAISNGGNTEGLWRTLTKDEWDYVFFSRSTPSGIRYAKATVNDVSGIILLPDDWNVSTYTLNNTNNTNSDFNSNTITAADWTNTLEANGAVFLPAAGYRVETSYENAVGDLGPNGYYWSSSYYNYQKAFPLYFTKSNLSNTYYSYPRYCGFSVRLVHDAE